MQTTNAPAESAILENLTIVFDNAGGILLRNESAKTAGIWSDETAAAEDIKALIADPTSIDDGDTHWFEADNYETTFDDRPDFQTFTVAEFVGSAATLATEGSGYSLKEVAAAVAG